MDWQWVGNEVHMATPELWWPLVWEINLCTLDLDTRRAPNANQNGIRTLNWVEQHDALASFLLEVRVIPSMPRANVVPPDFHGTPTPTAGPNS